MERMAATEMIARLRFAARLAVAAVFLYAGAVKACNPGAFVRDLWNYHLLGDDAAYWIAAILPYLELLCGLALLSGVLFRGARLIVRALLLVFLLALLSAAVRGLDIRCGCFGSAGEASPRHALSIALDLALLLAAQFSTGRARTPRA
jgi:putative oxidoreductase